MSFNPLDTRQEIQDTLYFFSAPYTKDKIQTGKMPIFILRTDEETITIHSPYRVYIDKTKFASTYEAKLELMKRYL